MKNQKLVLHPFNKKSDILSLRREAITGVIVNRVRSSNGVVKGLVRYNNNYFEVERNELLGIWFKVA